VKPGRFPQSADPVKALSEGTWGAGCLGGGAVWVFAFWRINKIRNGNLAIEANSLSRQIIA
jgi:hypothetical protein